jgi:capsular polysaccharide biosynthesis protein
LSSPFNDNLSLPVILAWLRVYWGKMILGGVVCAIVALPVSLYRTKSYESTATVLVSPPAFKDHQETISDMMPRTLPVEAYKAIALSPQLLDELIHKIPLENTSVGSLERRLHVELIEMGSRGAQGIQYTKTLMFHAEADKGETAAKIAQAWAEIFKSTVDDVVAKGVDDTFGLLETLHKGTKEDLEKADLALAEHSKAWNLDLLNSQLQANEKDYTDFQTALVQNEVELATAETKLKSLQEDLAKEPEKRVFFRAPSDDVYWNTTLQNGGKPKLQPDQGLRTEEPNPNYVELRTLEVAAKADVEGLKAKRDTTALKLEDLAKKIQEITVTLQDKTVERDALMREADNLKSSYGLVRAEYEKGRMADKTQSSDIVIIGKAVAPKSPSSTSSPKLVVMAAILGTLASGLLLMLKELSEMAPAPVNGQRRLFSTWAVTQAEDFPRKAEAVAAPSGRSEES